MKKNQNAFALAIAVACALTFSSCKKNTTDEPIAETGAKDKATVSYKEVNLPRTKSGILTYFNNCISSWKIISGQQLGDGNAAVQGYTDYVESLNTQTGLRPAMIGLDYGWSASTNITSLNNIAIDHWTNKKGLVTISWHADNPFESGYNPRFNSGNSTTASNVAVVDFDKLLDGAPASTARTNYRNELTKVADGLVALKNAGVVVVWRPFHENNGSWFWWCANAMNGTPPNKAKFKRLWEDMYYYFKWRGLENHLIWNFSLWNRNGTNFAPMNALYPGYLVDVVGGDFYGPTVSYTASDLTELQAFGKPVTVSEVGPSGAGLGNWDELALANTWRGKAAYFLQWSSWSVSGTLQRVAIVHNKNYNNMLWNSNVVAVD